MPKNQNIQTVVVNPPANVGSAVLIGAVVPAGMTRYVTFVHLTTRSSTLSGALVYICSAPALAASTITQTTASANQKMRIMIASHGVGNLDKDNVGIPAKIDTENPLFSIAAGSYLTAYHASAGTFDAKAVSLFVQYYDQ